MNPTATILIVDDNPTNLKLAADVLECEGHAVLCARNAEEAQKVLKRWMPDIILMDIQMPGMDGLTLTRLLKAESTYRHIPIVAMTAFAMKGDDQKAREAGCDGYISKPIDIRKLPVQITELLRARPVAAIQETCLLNIMLVEDDPTDMKLFSAVLISRGHRVLKESSAEQAIEAIKVCRPEVILLDLKLSGMDGLGLARRLKADPETQSIPIVAVTAAVEQFPREAVMQAGCDAYIVKPVDTRSLTGQIERAAAKRPEGL